MVKEEMFSLGRKIWLIHCTKIIQNIKSIYLILHGHGPALEIYENIVHNIIEKNIIMLFLIAVEICFSFYTNLRI